MDEEEFDLDQRPQPKIIWNVDKIIGVSALFVSLAACLLIAYQTFLMREQQLLSALPHLTIGNEGSYSANYKYVLSNQGVGPAFIENIIISIKGEKQESQDLAAFYIENSAEIKNLHKVMHSNVFPGMLIPAGEDIPIFEVDDSVEDAIRLHEVMDSYRENGLTFELIYASVYGERWKITESSLSPEKL